MLLRMTKAYSTTSTEALQVVSGVLPLDLQLALRRREYLYRRQGFRRFGHIDLTDARTPEDASKRLRKASLRLWEERWQLSEQAPVTHDFLPSIVARTRMQWLHPSHTNIQFLTGHGQFQHKLWTLGLSPTPLCDCEEIDTPAHMIFDCGLIPGHP